MRSAAAGEALSPVLPGIVDPVGGSAYLRRFERELAAAAPRPAAPDALERAASKARVVLLGEYHPLPSACLTACELLERARRSRRPVLCGLEMIHARDQAALDAWLAGRIGETELRQRIRYREEWGYPWSGPRALLRRARALGVPLFGLDIPPRGSVADLPWRDRVAAERIAHHLEGAPRKALFVAVHGEAHLARGHLPASLRRALPELKRGGKLLRVLHDTGLAGGTAIARDGDLFFRERAGRARRAPALARVYRRWATDAPPAGEIDVALVVHELIGAQASEVGIDPRRHRLGPARFLADTLPEVYGPNDARRALRRLTEAGLPRPHAERALRAATLAGARAVPRAGLLLVGRIDLRAITVACGYHLAAALRGDAGARDAPPRAWSAKVAAEALGYTLAALVDRGLPRPALSGIDRWLRDAGPRERAVWAEVRPLLRGLAFRAWPVDPRPAAATPFGARLAGLWLGARLASALEEERCPRARLRRWLARPLRSEPEGRRIVIEVGRA